MKELHQKKGVSEDHVEEEYGAELTPHSMQIKGEEENDLLSSQTNTGVIVGYVALFLALFSIVFYPIIFGSFAILIGLLALNYGARTLALTAIGFGAFSVLFNLLYPIVIR